MKFGREMDGGHCSGEGAIVMEKGKRQGSIQGNTYGKRTQLEQAWEARGTEFCQLLQPAGLKPGGLKLSVLG